MNPVEYFFTGLASLPLPVQIILVLGTLLFLLTVVLIVGLKPGGGPALLSFIRGLMGLAQRQDDRQPPSALPDKGTSGPHSSGSRRSQHLPVDARKRPAKKQ